MTMESLSRILCGRVTLSSTLIKVTAFIAVIYVTYSVIGHHNIELDDRGRDETISFTRSQSLQYTEKIERTTLLPLHNSLEGATVVPGFSTNKTWAQGAKPTTPPPQGDKPTSLRDQGLNATSLGAHSQNFITLGAQNGSQGHNSTPLAAQYENDRLIMYNRVPKCASTGIRFIMSKLARYNQFKLIISKIYDMEKITFSEERELIEDLSQNDIPSVFVRHVFFIDFKRHGFPQPIYINVVREPLQRLVSDYYFKRFHLGYMFPKKAEDKHRTYDECVQTELPECLDASPAGYFRIIPYFCGQDPRCHSPSQWALERAKENVIKHYSVVGIAEDVDSFMEAIEIMFPQYFTYAARSFKQKKDYLRQKLKTKMKPPPTNTTIAIMTTKLKYDYDFYHFIKQRFYDLFSALKRKS